MPTPLRARLPALRLFDVVRFAQKANSNTHILRLMKRQGAVVDSVSLVKSNALAGGFTPGLHNGHADIVFTADLLDRATLARVVELNIPVNCGSMDMLDQLGKTCGTRCGYASTQVSGMAIPRKTNTGGEHSKHGIWHGDLVRACEKIKSNGLALQGLHMHIGSGVDYAHLQEVCGAMLKLVEVVNTQGLDLHAISAGGGLSVPYQAGEPTIDTAHYFSLWDAARHAVERLLEHPVKLEIRTGRYLMAESGVLVTEVTPRSNRAPTIL